MNTSAFEDDSAKAARLGETSSIWRAGQARRLQLMLEAAQARHDEWVLDIGCGIGLYLERLAGSPERAFGVEYDAGRAAEAGRRLKSVVRAAAESLPFPSASFDLVLSHEVLEHVVDDQAAVQEMTRVLRPPDPHMGQRGGRLLLFVPNRGYPFETHGIFWRRHYYFGNIPLVNYLPRRWRDRLAPHVRAYSSSDLDRLFEGLPVRIVKRTVIFGAYDNIIARWPTVGRLLRALLQSLEVTPLRAFGLSHFWVLERT